MEGIETILSAEELEQQERKEKFSELLSIMSSIQESVIKSEHPSDEAQEVGTPMNDFIKKFEANGLKLKDYLLGGVLLYKDNTDVDSNYLYFDTKKGEIEKFIRDLKAEQEKRLS